MLALVVTVLGFVIALPYGIVAVAWSFSITRWLIRPPSILYSFAGTPLRYYDLWLALRGPTYATIGAAFVALSVYVIVDFPGPVLAQLIFKSCVFGTAYVIFSMMMTDGRELWHYLFSLVKMQFQPRAASKPEP
jgi:hypothetical protein